MQTPIANLLAMQFRVEG